MVRQWRCTCHGTCFYKIFTKFFLLITHYLLSKSPSLFASFGLVYWFLCSRSLALWLCGLGCLFLLCSCSCLSAFRSLCCSLDLPWFWIPGSPGWLELWNRMLWVTSWGCYWDGGEGGGITVLVYCSICSWSLNIICF